MRRLQCRFGTSFSGVKLQVRFGGAYCKASIRFNQPGDGLASLHFLAFDDQELLDHTLAQSSHEDGRRAWFDPAGRLKKGSAFLLEFRPTREHGRDRHGL